MRSRYSAYVLQLEHYLLATWHPDTRPTSLDLADDTTKWLGLEIKRHVTDGDHAIEAIRAENFTSCDGSPASAAAAGRNESTSP